MTLDRLPLEQTGTVSAIRLSDRELGWVRAVGIFEGESISVLRRALFGGPLHVRTGSGGEFALDRALASNIDVTEAGETSDESP